jgi:tetratricopeptide (TPR) repeat protein
MVVLPGSELPQPVHAKLVMWAGLFAGLQGAYLQAQHHLSDSLHLWRSVGDRRHEALVLNMLGSIARYQNDAERATAMYEAAVPIAQDTGDTRNLAMSVHHLGDMARIRGDLTKARVLYQKSLTLERQVGDHRRLAVTLTSLATLAAHEGDIKQATALCRKGLEIGSMVGSKTCVAKGLYALAETARAQGQTVRAARLLSAATALLDVTDSAVALLEQAAYDCLLGGLRECLGQAKFAAAWDEGQAMVSRGWEEIVAYALER